MQAAGAKIEGMNYFTDSTTMGKAIVSLDFGLASHRSSVFSSKGTATEVSLDYFAKMLAPLKGKVNAITKFLMGNMLQFQLVSQNEQGSYSSGQILCLVSPSFIIGDTGIIQYVMFANFASQ